jgi:hypothetical protein
MSKIYNQYGVQVGTIEKRYGEYWLLLLSILIGVGALVMPVWALYQMGKGEWSRYGLITKSASIIFIIYWLGFGFFAQVKVSSGGANPNSYTFLIPIAVILILAASYYVGRSRRY